MTKKSGEPNAERSTIRGTKTPAPSSGVVVPRGFAAPVDKRLSVFSSNQPDILLTTRSYQCRMPYDKAVELAFLCGAVEKDPSVTFEIMQNTQFIGRKSDHVVIRKQFGKFTHYVQPWHKQEELQAWQQVLNAE